MSFFAFRAMSSHLFRPQLDPSTRLCLGEACFSGEVGNSGTQTFGGELPEILGANGCCFKEGLTHTPSLQKKIMSSLGYHLGTVFRYRDTSAWQARRSVWDEVWIQSFQGHGNCVYQVFLRSHKATTLSSWAQAKDAKTTPLNSFEKDRRFPTIEYNALVELASTKDNRGRYEIRWGLAGSEILQSGSLKMYQRCMEIV